MIFVDTSFWIALRNRRDPRHAEAATLLRTRADGGLATSNQIRGETWTYLRRRVGHDGAVEFLDALERSPRVQLFSISEKQEQQALKWLTATRRTGILVRGRDELRAHAGAQDPRGSRFRRRLLGRRVRGVASMSRPGSSTEPATRR